MESKTCEVWIVVDEDGDYTVAKDGDTAMEQYNEDYGGALARRMVRIKVKIPTPKVETVEVDVAIPTEKGGAAVTV